MKINSDYLYARNYYPVICNQRNKIAQNFKTDKISFGMKVNYGVPASLPFMLQEKILNIHKNIDYIQNFFLNTLSTRPSLAASIKKAYPDLISKRSSRLAFRLPDTDNTVDVLKSITRPSILYISINDGNPEFNGIVADGKDKLIANILKKHPHMLPSGIKYMNTDMIKNAEPEKYINIADEKVQQYADYIKKVESGEIGLLPEKAEKPVKRKVKKIIKEPQKEKVTENAALNAQSDGQEIPKPENDDNLKAEMRELGKKNGELAANEYFNAFKKQFFNAINDKISDFSEKLKKIMSEQ